MSDTYWIRNVRLRGRNYVVTRHASAFEVNRTVIKWSGLGADIKLRPVKPGPTRTAIINKAVCERGAAEGIQPINREEPQS